MHANHPLNLSNIDATGKKRANLEAKVHLPLKALHKAWSQMHIF